MLSHVSCLARGAQEALLTEAYVSLGGNADRDKKVQSQLLKAVASDFVGAGAADRAMDAIVKHRMVAVQELLGMGGALDSDDEEELKDTSVLSFEDLGAFAKSLHDNGADPASTGDDDDAGGSEGPLR